jgi:RNA polymerase sigma-70 factor (ECF subfamily)
MKRQGAKPIQQADTDLLIQLVRSGDCDAFSELMGRHDSIVRRTANSILKNTEDAEDATQETYLKVFMKIHTFEGASKFSTWLTRIAINTSLMRLRQRRCRQISSIEELTDGDASSFLPLADTRLDPEQQSCAADMRLRLYEAVRRLPSQLREVAEDQIYLELPMKDLAEKRSMSIAAAKSRAYRARKLLAGSLNPSRRRLSSNAP